MRNVAIGDKEMADHVMQTIVELQDKLKEQEKAVIKTKELINLLCEQTGKPAIYKDAELEASAVQLTIKDDQFYGRSLAGSMKEILNIRKAADIGPATPREIYDDLVKGGYLFNTDVVVNRLTGVRVSLRKSSSIFHKLPNGKYGLLEWYPNAKKLKPHNNDNKTEIGTDTSDEIGGVENDEPTNDTGEES